MLFAFEAQLLRMCHFISNVNFTHESIFECKFTIASNKLNYKHCFANGKISKCISSTLNSCNDRNFWLNRNDVSFDVEVYWIDERIWTLHELDCYCTLTLASFGSENFVINNEKKYK